MTSTTLKINERIHKVQKCHKEQSEAKEDFYKEYSNSATKNNTHENLLLN